MKVSHDLEGCLVGDPALYPAKLPDWQPVARQNPETLALPSERNRMDVEFTCW